ncbi:peroxisome assembly protein 12-A-like [Panonychus citri]|uniref:peroxisome assembly protein 12-A-like n=1 Tax=Panonychus citri TaxID=50023 RepID=UPI002307A54A|nr:peroxisome assembly protein 12-A-like [Panonychus citri]
MALTPDTYTVPNSLMSGHLPSIYEVFAEDSLSRSLRTGIKYLSQVLASNYPGRFRLLYQYFDEAYLLYDIIVEGLHLRSFNGSFSEYFYHLKRIKSDANCISEKLSTRDVVTSLLVMASFSYVKAKLDKIHDELARLHFEGGITRDGDPFAYHFVNNYPYIKALWEVSCLVYQIKYAVGKSSTHNPLYHLLGLRLIRADSKDLQGWRSNLSSFILPLTKGIGIFLTSSAMLIQFLDFWYSRENSRSTFSNLKIPPAPKKRDLLNCPPNYCPVCSQPRRNEALLKTSGFLFCQQCLIDYVEKNEKCPITGYPTNLSQIVLIYQSDSF